VVVNSSGELSAEPAGPVVQASGLEPGAARSGRTALRNETGATLRVAVRALPSTHDADRVLRLELTGGGHPVYRGALGGLRGFSPATFTIAPGHKAELTVRASLPRGASGWRGRMVDVPLELRSTPVRGRR
jgi:hypothetical protein